MSTDTEILLIEDDPAIAESLSEALGLEGYHVQWESTGAGGVAYARDGNPKLVVLDVRLPDGSGFDVCREMRRLGLRQPILMLTVQADELDKVLGLEMGADDYLTKPYRLRELMARIRALLRRAYGELSTAEADMLYLADLVIDRTRARVSRGDTAINLTPTEFRLLVFLAQHPGQVFSRGAAPRSGVGSRRRVLRREDGQRPHQTTPREDRARTRSAPARADRARAGLPAGRSGVTLLGRFRSRVARISLTRRLPASFAVVALLTMLVLGAILVPLLGDYYGRSEVAYLEAGAERAVQDLSASTGPLWRPRTRQGTKGHRRARRSRPG